MTWLPVAPQAVRDLMTLNTDSTSRYSDGMIGSNIDTTARFLERATHRYFEARENVTLTFTTNGDASVDLPGVRAVDSVTQAGTALTLDESFWLIPDTQQSGVFTAVQLRAFTSRAGPWWLHFRDWFDRNLDSPYHPANQGGGYGSMPNDLVVVADVGYTAANLPAEFLKAVVAGAAFLTLRPHALLTDATNTPEGFGIPLDSWPFEVQSFVEGWRIGTRSAVSL